MLNDKSLVFISDEGYNGKKFSIKRKDSEGMSEESIKEILETLKRLSNSVVKYTDVALFENEIKNIKNPVVINSYYGEASPASKTLVPTICDINQIPYTGADSFAQMLCNDKYLSKKYMEKFGLHTSNCVIIYNPYDENELKELSYLKYPVIVKPNYGGGSNGITSKNVKKTEEETIQFIKELYTYQNLPILIEEYAQGNEVCVIMFGNKTHMYLMQEVQIIINGTEFYTNEIYGLESKKLKEGKKELKASNLISDEDKKNMIRLFQSFTKLEFMRIDCRVNNGHTSIIELSPDSFFGSSGAFYKGFELNGYTFEDMLRMMIENCFSITL